MDERTVKRLLLMLVMAIAVIWVAKFMLTKAVTNVGKAAIEKKQSAATQQAPAASADILVVDSTDTSTASAVAEVGIATSSVEAATR